MMGAGFVLRMALLLTVLTGAACAQSHSDGAATLTEGPQAAGVAHAPPAEPTLMNNDTIVRMHRAGLGDDLILQTIAAQPGRYDMVPDALIALKGEGLSDAVLSAMASKQRRQIAGRSLNDANSAPGPIELSPVNEIGVYYKATNGSWQRMESERVRISSGGFVKSTLTYGIIKEDRNGVVAGRESKLILPRPCEFLVYVADGVDGNEYDLLRFRLNSKNREFRTLTGGVIHSTSGAERDEVSITFKRIAPHTYTFSIPVDLPGGEYGILPPGTGNVTNGGKIYTFAVVE